MQIYLIFFLEGHYFLDIQYVNVHKSYRCLFNQLVWVYWTVYYFRSEDACLRPKVVLMRSGDIGLGNHSAFPHGSFLLYQKRRPYRRYSSQSNCLKLLNCLNRIILIFFSQLICFFFIYIEVRYKYNCYFASL